MIENFKMMILSIKTETPEALTRVLVPSFFPTKKHKIKSFKEHAILPI